jgi:hypothetical protein
MMVAAGSTATGDLGFGSRKINQGRGPLRLVAKSRRINDGRGGQHRDRRSRVRLSKNKSGSRSAAPRVAKALRQTLPEFVMGPAKNDSFTKFIVERQDMQNVPIFRLAS